MQILSKTEGLRREFHLIAHLKKKFFKSCTTLLISLLLLNEFLLLQHSLFLPWKMYFSFWHQFSILPWECEDWKHQVVGFFFPMYSIGSYHSWTPSPLHTTSGKKLIFLTICGISDVLFILSFILFKCYFYASTLDSWMFCSAHSLPPFLKGFSKQCWKILACEQGTDIPMVCPKVLCYLKPNWRVSSAVLEDSGSLMKSIVSSDLG